MSVPKKDFKKLVRLNYNPYVIFKIIGQGQYGLVYLAHSRGRKEDGTKIPTQLAIKEYLYSRFIDQEGNNFCEEYWAREVVNTELQSHAPNAQLQIFDSGKIVDATHQEYYIVLNYIVGKTLKDWFVEKFGKRSQLKESEIGIISKYILIPIAKHLDYCHKIGLIHRDLSIDNILIKEPHHNVFVPVIIDWGSSKKCDPNACFNPKRPYFDANPVLSTAFSNRGTPPEIIMGLNPIAASDIYMFGHLMYFIFSGGKTCRTPAVKEDYILHPQIENPSCPQEYNQLVEKCTQYEPADRIKSMDAIIHILEKLAEKITPEQITGFLKDQSPSPIIVPKKQAPTKSAPKENVFQAIAASPPSSNLNAADSRAGSPPFASPYPVVKPAAKKISKPVSKPAPKPAAKPVAKPAAKPAAKKSQTPTKKSSAKPSAKPIVKPVPPPIPQITPQNAAANPFSVDEKTIQFADAFFKYFQNPYWADQKHDTVAIYYTFFQGVSNAYKAHSPLILSGQAPGNIYYIGPTCGSLEDLRSLLTYFDQVLTHAPDTIIVFLGHYFLSIEQALEAFTFLLSFKCLHPENVFLLRGPTEDQTYLESLGFLSQMTKQFEKYAKFIAGQIYTILANLDLLYQAEMSDSLHVLASAGGIPFIYRDPASIVNLTLIEQSLSARQSARNNLDEITQTILWGRPNEMADSVAIDSQGNLCYSWSLLQSFFQINNIRYFITADQGLHGGHRLIWNQISAIYSCSTCKGQPIGDAKILRVNIHGMADLIIKDLPMYLERDYDIKQNLND